MKKEKGDSPLRETGIKETFVKCDCGTHLLQVQCETETYEKVNSEVPKKIQTWYFAMFNFGDEKMGFLDKVRFLIKFMRTGKLYSDQLVLTPDEINKFVEFVNQNKL